LPASGILKAMLPRLRTELDFFPSPFEDKPGLVIRDPFRYSDATLIIPPALLPCLEFFDGSRSDLDLREFLVRGTGDLQAGDFARQLRDALDKAGFLENDTFAECRDRVHREFELAAVRQPAHAGSGYPLDPSELAATFSEYLDGAPPRDGRVAGIAAPHVSPFGGIASYRAAYSALSPADADRTFVILGTSHYGAPDRLGLTAKAFVTPLGQTLTDPALVDAIARGCGEGASMEDYCHSFEHTIEFQVVFLQHLFGPQIKVVPILCGSYARSLYQGGFPEDGENVRRMLGTLGEIAAAYGDRLAWVLGVDMAHVGARYGDPLAARPDRAKWRRSRAAISFASPVSKPATLADFGSWSAKIMTTSSGAAPHRSIRFSRRFRRSAAVFCNTSSGISMKAAWLASPV
jgi:AmmeMemoRadiSam system protein B